MESAYQQQQLPSYSVVNQQNYSMQTYQHQQPNQTWNISQNKSSYIVSKSYFV